MNIADSRGLDSEWRFTLADDTEPGSLPWRLTAYRRSGDEWIVDSVVPLPMDEWMEVEQVLDPLVDSGSMGPDTPKWINQVAFAFVSQLVEMGLGRLPTPTRRHRDSPVTNRQ